MSTGKIIFGMLAGATVGAALGILFAPEKGTIARNQISKKSEDIWDALKCKIEDFISTAGKEVKAEAKDLYAKAKDVKEDAQDLYAKGKEKVQEVKTDYKANPSANFH